MLKYLSRILLGFCTLAAMLAISAAFYLMGAQSIESWLVTAAALAVLTSVLSAWSALLTTEMQERQLMPDVAVFVDFLSRYHAVLLRMKNKGASAAFNVKDEWEGTICDAHGDPIRFAQEGASVTVLQAGETMTRFVDVYHKFRGRYNGETYSGIVNFQDASGRKYSTKFVVDPGQYYSAKNITYDDERVRTDFELQQVPRRLEEIRKELVKLVATKRAKDAPPPEW